MNRLPDPRRRSQCVYTQAHLLWSGILLFLMHLGSRRQLRLERLAETFTQNLAKLCGQTDLDTIADPDTLAYYAEQVSPVAVEKLLAFMSTTLIRMKALDAFRLDRYFTSIVRRWLALTLDWTERRSPHWTSTSQALMGPRPKWASASSPLE